MATTPVTTIKTQSKGTEGARKNNSRPSQLNGVPGITGNTLNILSLIGMVALIGIAVNDAIIKVDTMRRLKNGRATDKRAAARETQEVFAPLANRLGIWHLKWELEDLSFRFLNTKTYMEIAAGLRARREEREARIQEVIDYLEQEGYPPLRIGESQHFGQTGRVSIPASTSSQYITALLMLAPTLGLAQSLSQHTPTLDILQFRVVPDASRWIARGSSETRCRASVAGPRSFWCSQVV